MTKAYFPSESKAIEEINKQYAWVLTGDDCLIVKIETSKGLQTITPMKEKALYNFYANKLVNAGKKLENPIKLWRTSTQRREYTGGIEFNPFGVPSDKLNSFLGYGVEPSTTGSWKCLREHIFHAVCNSNEGLFAYFMDWYAHAIQRPLDRPETALVLVGGQGCGKSSVLEHFGVLFGSHSYKDSDLGKIVGRFQEHIIGKQYVFWDEANLLNHKRAIGRLKDLITSPTLSIEGKGKAVIQVPNCIRFVMASNDAHVIQASGDERRFAMFEVNNKYQQKSEHFAAIAQELKDGGYARLLYDLKHRAIKTDLRQVPTTPLLYQQRIESLPSIRKWWFEALQSGEFGDGVSWWGNEVKTQSLRDNYLAYLNNIKSHEQHPSPVSFGKHLSKLIHFDGYRARKTKGERGYTYQLPALSIARIHFESEAGLKGYEW